MNQPTAHLPQAARWTFDDLLMDGVTGADVPQPNLTNAIHALFQFRPHTRHALEEGPVEDGSIQILDAEDVRVDEWYFYHRAFQLATNFITSNVYLDWWWTLALGPVTRDGNNSPENVFLVPSAEFELLRRRTKDKLLEVAAHLDFSFKDMENEHGAWGVTYSNLDGVEIALNEKFLLFARQALSQQARLRGVPDPFPGRTRYADEWEISQEHVQRMQWMMAITLCRQCCRAVWLWRQLDGPTIPEPRHPMAPEYTPNMDLGLGWEFWRLGYSTREITPDEVDLYRSGQVPPPREPLAIGLAASFRGRNSRVPDAVGAYCPMPSSYIALWFQENTWMRIRAGQQIDECMFLPSSRITRNLYANGA